MARVVVPVRYPLTRRSKRTLSEAFSLARDREAETTVLHVNLYQNGRGITQAELRDAVEAEFGRLPGTQYVVRAGFLLEETIIDEILGENADVVVVGESSSSRRRRLLRRVFSTTDVETALREGLDCSVVTVAA
jgi:nucleotide-binding universal stress UspA family protein